MTLTITDADHRANIDSDLEGRWENARDDVVSPDGKGATPEMDAIDAALAWLSSNDTGEAYPLTLDLTTAPDDVRFQLALTIENLNDTEA